MSIRTKTRNMQPTSFRKVLAASIFLSDLWQRFKTNSTKQERAQRHVEYPTWRASLKPSISLEEWQHCTARGMQDFVHQSQYVSSFGIGHDVPRRERRYDRPQERSLCRAISWLWEAMVQKTVHVPKPRVLELLMSEFGRHVSQALGFRVTHCWSCKASILRIFADCKGSPYRNKFDCY